MRLTNRVRFGSRELCPTVARERCLRATIWLIAGMTQMAPRVRLPRLPFAVVALDRASTELAAATCSPPLVVFLGTCTLPELCKKMTRTGIGTNQRPKHLTNVT